MCQIEKRFEEYLLEYNSIDVNHSKLISLIVNQSKLNNSIVNHNLNFFNWFSEAWFSNENWIKTSSIVNPLNWFPKALFNDEDWLNASSSITLASDWMNWFERAWFDEVKKAHNNKEVKKAHYTVAKKMKNLHKDDNSAS